LDVRILFGGVLNPKTTIVDDSVVVRDLFEANNLKVKGATILLNGATVNIDATLAELHVEDDDLLTIASKDGGNK
jgi:hypothetical protein